MARSRFKQIAAAGWLIAGLVGTTVTARAQAPAPPASTAPNGAVLRRVIMKDALSCEQFKAKLDQMKSTGLFRDKLPGIDPKQPVAVDINFLVSGNYLLVVGSKDWVDNNIATIELMGYLFERPRAHLQLNLRVVQLTGPANAEVIQMSETVRALVDAQREEVVRTFAELDDYLTGRLRARQSDELKVLQAARTLLPGLGTGTRPLTVPEILLLLMIDRSSPAPRATTVADVSAEESQSALLDLPRALHLALLDPQREDARIAVDIAEELAAWKKSVTGARDWCTHYAEALKKSKENTSVGAFRQALQDPNSALPSWLGRRLQRSLDLTERLYPTLVRKHTEESVRELQRRFTSALERCERLEAALARGEAMTEPDSAAKTVKNGTGSETTRPTTATRTTLLGLKSLAEEMVPAPLALFDAVAVSADNSAPTPAQLIGMFQEYAEERAKLDVQLATDRPGGTNYAKLLSLESGLNLWMRRVSEGMARALEQQFYRRYVNELRLMANKQLGKSSSRDLLMETNLDQVPDVARDLLLADTGVNIFVSNSISMQFAPEATNTVSAQVQSALPSKLGILERVQQAEQASKSFNALQQAFGINGESVVKALLAGGQAVPVQAGMSLTASPSIGFDAGTVTLTLTANQTLQPGSDKVADRVTNHSINNATVTALSYEPMVLSTLASNISYFEETGGIPILRKIPGIGPLTKDIPFAPFKGGKRQKGIYQSSVIILEPVVIPTIEDLVRFHGGERMETAPGVTVKVNPD